MDPQTIAAIAVWPVTVPAASVVVAGIFYKPIAEKLRQLLKLGAKGVNAEFGHADAQAAQKPDDAAAKALPAPNTVTPSPPPPNLVFGPVEADAKRQLAQHVGMDDALQRDWAVRLYAGAAVELGHERAYRLIFGSQIEALQALNQRGAIDVSEGIQGFNSAVAADPAFYANSNYTFEMWARFLINAGYVETSSANLVPGTKAAITPLGRDFLVWMAARGVSTTKRG